MGLVVSIPPTVEPLTLEEARQHLRVDFDDQDTLILSLISSARKHCEQHTRRTIAPTTYRYTIDEFPSCNRPIKLPVPPVVSVVSIEYKDVGGVVINTLAPSDYVVDVTSEPARIAPALNKQWPSTYPEINAVEITFTAGYAAVPDTIKTAMKLLIGAWYENREAVTDKQPFEVPWAVESLLAAHSWGSYV